MQGLRRWLLCNAPVAALCALTAGAVGLTPSVAAAQSGPGSQSSKDLALPYIPSLDVIERYFSEVARLLRPDAGASGGPASSTMEADRQDSADDPEAIYAAHSQAIPTQTGAHLDRHDAHAGGCEDALRQRRV